MKQLELHEKIEEFFKADVGSANVNVAQNLLVNEDAKQFFFSQANESWIAWLWKNDFLNAIKKKVEDSTQSGYQMPELGYLDKMAREKPAEVAQIISSVKISEETFNPAVIGRFLWIINSLPAEQIKTLTTKIRDERWIYLMRGFRKTGYEFKKNIKELTEKNESSAILELAQAILIVKSKEEITEEGSSFDVDNPFYVSDLDASNIFEALAGIEESHTGDALRIVTEVMTEIIKLANPDEMKIFDYADLFSLYDVDFFTLEMEDIKGGSEREDVKGLAAAIKKLVERTIGKDCENVDEVKRLFEYIDELPSCRSMWRLKLFALVQCPEVFKDKLREAFWRVFNVGERYFEIEGGAEYHKALARSFSAFDEKTTQREYVQKVLEYFGAKLEDEDKEKWRKRDGTRVLSLIKDYLTADEKKRAEEVFKVSIDKVTYTPEPVIGKMEAGIVSHRSPANIEEYTIEQIISNLKDEWAPEKLKVQFEKDDFLNSRGAEGLGEALKEDIKKRTNEYLKDIISFFERDKIHAHYLYSLLRGIEEMLRNKQSLGLDQIGQTFGLFNAIRIEGEKIPFTREDDKSWLVNWIGVHKVFTDILLYILKDKESREVVHKEHRETIKNLISYLLTVSDPTKEDEKPKYGGLHHVAINSVKGRAYEAFVVFTENDGKVLSSDTKAIYKKTLLDDSLVVRFVIGRYLASFYFRDKDFITDFLPKIFPKDDPDKKDIYLATWEGYLSYTLYDKLFIVLKDYYQYAIDLNPENYTKRKYLKSLDASLAIHLALAFTRLGLNIEDDLFVKFWGKKNTIRHKEFISFIGQSCITRDQAGDEWLKDNKVSKEKLINFWDWALANILESEALSGFGFWINPSKEILNDDVVVEKIAETLKKSDGDIYWDYGLLRRLPVFAEKKGEVVLEIITSYLLDFNNNLNQNRSIPMFSIDNEIKTALSIIYKNGDEALKQKVTNLINTLIEKGSSMFWELKSVVSNTKKP